MFELVLRTLLLAAEVAAEWLFAHVFYVAGWLLLRAFSLGRYPSSPLWVDDPLAAGGRWTGAFGMLVLLGVPLTLLALFYG